ncbi:MAG: two pore domain potassium channel family protein [Gammaproteobacteria bacterium]|nr:MAG: two pore domain potassium channel family protein [Gammaproteobacteria bacterium]
MNAVKLRLRIYLLLLLLVLVIGSLGFMYFENLSFLDSIYMNIVTMSTVGYGDIQPTTVWGKFVVIFIIVGGVASPVVVE